MTDRRIVWILVLSLVVQLAIVGLLISTRAELDRIEQSTTDTCNAVQDLETGAPLLGDRRPPCGPVP
jgi:hypothetical protein